MISKLAALIKRRLSLRRQMRRLSKAFYVKMEMDILSFSNDGGVWWNREKSNVKIFYNGPIAVNKTDAHLDLILPSLNTGLALHTGDNDEQLCKLIVDLCSVVDRSKVTPTMGDILDNIEVALRLSK